MFEFWRQNSVKLAYYFGTTFQTDVSENEFGTIKLKNVGSNDFRLQHNIILNFSLFLFFKINIICLPYWTFINRIHSTSYWAIVGFGKFLGIWKSSSNPKIKKYKYFLIIKNKGKQGTMVGKFYRHSYFKCCQEVAQCYFWLKLD